MTNEDIANIITIVEGQEKQTKRIMKETRSNMVTYSFATDDSRFFEVRVVERKKKVYIIPAEITGDDYLDNLNSADMTL